ncbi:MAG: 4Fe-4S dicluster domain-containing protein [Planctomycetaceae bacterium]|nr:MAG: 4Fe-4S dicluster domain-containing protein [Planctomycetaceae bacterium]
MRTNQQRQTAMTSDVYERLAAHLDDLPGGFTRTEGGVELRILRRLFAPEEAEIAVHLTVIPEAARVVARRARVPVPQAATHLDAMDRKGLVLCTRDAHGPPRYMALQFVVGFWEAQVNRLSRELVEDVLDYEPAVIQPEHWRKAPQMRTIPVQRSIQVTNEVMPYELGEQLVRKHTSLAVANCICRQAMRTLGRGCEKPEETCLTLGTAADYVVDSGRGRKISLSETLEILDRADETGLVLQPDNAKDPLFICTCCGCCCGVLRSFKRHPRPASIVSSPFVTRLDNGACHGCQICTKRCPMDAIRVVEKKAILDQDRCIGCGLCVSACPKQCLTLERKPNSEQANVPKTHIRSALKVAQARGKLGIGALIKLQIQSKLDRLLACGTFDGSQPREDAPGKP